MFTSNFANAGDRPNAIAIVRYVPRFPKPWSGHLFRKLAPTGAMLKMSGPAFEAHFAELLKSLDANAIYCELEAIVAELQAAPVLICYEKPGFQCHRRLVAEWLERELGIIIPELGIDRAETPPYADSPLQPAKPKRAKQAKGQQKLFK